MEQKSLLDEMIHDGISAILVKVATLGLDQQHIGKTLVEVKLWELCFFYLVT